MGCDEIVGLGTGWNGIRNPAPAMHRNVETLIGRLATDPRLRSRFAENPERALRELHEQGMELTQVELAALGAIDPEALRSFAESLDRRLRRAPLAIEPRSPGGATPNDAAPE